MVHVFTPCLSKRYEVRWKLSQVRSEVNWFDKTVADSPCLSAQWKWKPKILSKTWWNKVKWDFWNLDFLNSLYLIKLSVKSWPTFLRNPPQGRNHNTSIQHRVPFMQFRLWSLISFSVRRPTRRSWPSPPTTPHLPQSTGKDKTQSGWTLFVQRQKLNLTFKSFCSSKEVEYLSFSGHKLPYWTWKVPPRYSNGEFFDTL